ncbi:nucleotidyltransferase domain-containing protein [Fibrella aquatilis]|uniref:Nucleotidyltransferase domain-containing protein n=1 Tax=Fibrella aquatilis TaxID=2817059 RepID=A0A939JYS5_9BACT|nr:nucleotidyltransferase domain-containing protein [Fibrella aquatilis]MBO0930683.1 nucleotidyltransferase domain-containing protein [Fibrella aquatilis]
MTDPEFLQAVKRSVLEIDPQAEVWLFGSRARGDARPDSDWDFLVLTEKHVNWGFKSQVRDQLYEIGFRTNHIISTVIQSTTDSPFWMVTELYQNVVEEGKKL